ncbi:phage tail protein [Escherichia coli]|nr:phage tail protein [Escherichia coli]
MAIKGLEQALKTSAVSAKRRCPGAAAMAINRVASSAIIAVGVTGCP